MRTERPFVVRVLGHLLLTAALTTLVAAEVRAQSGVIESWRDSAGNWSGKRHALDPAGNLLVVGDTVVGDIIQVRKYTASGQLLWSRIYDPPERVVSYWIASDIGGNAWVTAARITGSQSSRVGFVVLKYDPQGNLVFVDVQNGGLALRVLTDSAGNGYVIGNGWFAGTLADNFMVVKYAPDGRRLWTGFLESGSTTFLAGPRSLALSPDETRLAVVGGGFSTTWRALSVALFDTASGQRLWNYLDTTKYGAHDVAFSPDGTSLYAGSTEIGFTNSMALHKFDLAGNRIFSRTYTEGVALVRIAVDPAGNVVAIGTADAGSYYLDWVTIKTNPSGGLLWARRYDATRVNHERPEWVAVDSAGAVYVAGIGGPGPNTGVVSFLKPVTVKYNSNGVPIWATFVGGNAQVTVDPATGSVFTLATGGMTSARFDQTGASDPIPAAPTNLTGTSNFNGVEFRIDITWTDNATNEFLYAVERCAGAGCTGFVEIGRAVGENMTGFRDAALPSGATFTYRVRAIGLTGNSSYSNTVVVSTAPAAGAPAAPSNLVAAPLSGRSVQLSWSDNSTGESQFSIERCIGAGCSAFTPIGVAGANAIGFLDTTTIDGQTYSYRVRAQSSGASSDYSNVATVTTPAVLTAPANLIATSTARRRIALTWTNTATSATSITVQRCAGSACTAFATVAEVAATSTSWTDSGARSGSRYRYRVCASNPSGSSPYSNIASATAR